MSLHNFLLLHLRSYFQNSSSCFIGVSKHLATIKALGLRPRAFICFSVFGYPDETLALVLEIVHNIQNVKIFHRFNNLPQYNTLVIHAPGWLYMLGPRLLSVFPRSFMNLRSCWLVTWLFIRRVVCISHPVLT